MLPKLNEISMVRCVRSLWIVGLRKVSPQYEFLIVMRRRFGHAFKGVKSIGSKELMMIFVHVEGICGSML